jgi:glycosyltransferase involved in cell wall biosynthesis
VIGSGGRATVSDLASESVHIIGYVPNLDEPLARTRVFVAPLFAGAGLKGKVLEAISRGVPCVLSTVAAESTGLVDGINCLVADSRDAWAEAVIRLYTDEVLWEQIGSNARRLSQTKYSFGKAVSAFEDALTKIEIFGRKDWGLAYKYARPQRYGY